MDRRRFLALLVAGAAVLGLPAEAADVPRVPVDPADADRVRAIFRTIFGEGADEVDIVARLEETLPYIAEDKLDAVRALPALIDELSRVLVPTFVAWRSLDDAAKIAALEDWGTSPLEFRRMVYFGLRRMLLAIAYTDAATWPAIGYPGPWLDRFVLPVHPLRFGSLA